MSAIKYIPCPVCEKSLRQFMSPATVWIRVFKESGNVIHFYFCNDCWLEAGGEYAPNRKTIFREKDWLEFAGDNYAKLL